MKTKTLIVDGRNLIMRNFLAYPRHLAAEGGERTSLIHGSFLELFRQVRMFEPERIVMTWDSRSAFRQRLLPTYKLGRDGKRRGTMTEADYRDLSEQLEIFHGGLAALGVAEVKVEGVEGDDLVALFSMARVARPVTIASTDHDFWQLIREDVQIYDPRTKGCYNHLNFKRLTGFDDPDHHLAFKVIKGDPGDSIPPAIPRLGEEKARVLARLLEFPETIRSGEIEHLSEIILDVEPYRTVEIRRLLARNFKLVCLYAAVVIQLPLLGDVDAPAPRGSWEGFLKFCQRYQLATVMKDFAATRSSMPLDGGD